MDNGFVILECEVDVLMSFKDAIKKQNVIVSRQERDYNLYQVDNKMKFYNTNATKVREFPTKHFSMNNTQFLLVMNGVTGGNS